MHPLARAALVALISLAPLPGLAQVSTTQSPISPAPGVLLFRDKPQDFIDQFWNAFSSDVAPYASRLSKWVTPLPKTVWEGTSGDHSHFTFLYGDTSSATRSALSHSTLNRACSLIDPTAIDPTAVGIINDWSANWEGTASEADANRVFIYTSTPIGDLTAPGWYDKSQADRSGCPDSAACHYGAIRFSCITYALPGQTLSASSYNITPGQSVTLNWTDTVYRDTAFDYVSSRDPVPPSNFCLRSPAPKTKCSATGFTLSGKDVTVYDGGEYDAELRRCTQQSSYNTFVVDPTGSVTVSPKTTTTYTFTCTNGNGTTKVSATVNVGAAVISKPDLTSSGVSPTSVTAGGAVKFSATIKNQGTAATGGSFPVLYQKATSSSGADASNIGTDGNAPALAAGAFETSTMDTSVSLAAGTWYVRACANTTNNSTFSVSESNTTNNCSAWTAVTVTAVATPVNGACAATHYSCSAGTSINNSSNSTSYTWTCAGSNGGTSASCSEAKSSPASVSCNPSPQNADVGQTVTWTATPAAGSSFASYAWSGDAPLAGKTGKTVSIQYATPGAKSGSVEATSGFITSLFGNGITATAVCDASVSVSSQPLINSCGASPNPSDINQQVRWTSSVSGGKTPYAYQWSGDVSGTVATPTASYSTAGQKNATLTVTDANGASVAKTCSTLTVNPPALPDLTSSGVSPGTANVGQATTLSATITNTGAAGTGAGFPDLFEISQVDNPSLFSQIYATKSYASAALSGGGSNTASVSYTFPSAGTWYVRACANTDARGNTPADSYTGTPESNYGNNCSGGWTVVTVGSVCFGLGCTTGDAGTGPGGPGGPGSACYYGWNGQPKTNVPSQCCSLTPGVCPAAPTASLSASPAQVDVGQSSTLSWNSTGATNCSGTGFAAGAPSGSRSTGKLNSAGTQNYQVTCSGPGGTSAPAFASVEVLAPNLNITAAPARVRNGGTATLSWSASGVKRCTVSGPGVSASGNADKNNSFSAGSPQTITVSGQSTYTISCTTNGPPISKSVTVNVLPGFQEF